MPDESNFILTLNTFTTIKSSFLHTSKSPVGDMVLHVIHFARNVFLGSDGNSEWKDITSSVSETVIGDALETGRISIDHVVSGR